MNMTDMVEEAQEICEKARASVAMEDCMDAAYKLCDLQVLLVRMEYEAKRDDAVVTQKENLNSIPVVCPSPKEMGIGYMYTGQDTTSAPKCNTTLCDAAEPRFDNQPNPEPTVTIPDLNGTPTVTEEIGETGQVEGEVGEPTILDLRDEELPHAPEVTSGSRFTLGGILGRH